MKRWIALIVFALPLAGCAMNFTWDAITDTNGAAIPGTRYALTVNGTTNSIVSGTNAVHDPMPGITTYRVFAGVPAGIITDADGTRTNYVWETTGSNPAIVRLTVWQWLRRLWAR